MGSEKDALGWEGAEKERECGSKAATQGKVQRGIGAQPPERCSRESERSAVVIKKRNLTVRPAAQGGRNVYGTMSSASCVAVRGSARKLWRRSPD